MEHCTIPATPDLLTPLAAGTAALLQFTFQIPNSASAYELHGSAHVTPQ